MSLVYQHTINKTSKTGLWHIEENEDFFLKRVPVPGQVSHPHKRLQHLAGRYLLPILFDDFPLNEILIADTRKPYLPDEQYHFSISHCGQYAAAIASSTHRVGIDIEIPTLKVLRIAHKFLNQRETELINQTGSTEELLQMTTLFWSCKEALFKWNSAAGVDFSDHLRILAVEGSLNEGILHCSIQQPVYTELITHYSFINGLMMSRVLS
ncbi:MAG: 4'-phosphopantetheinyl transferase family protein [Lacibacter sp.]